MSRAMRNVLLLGVAAGVGGLVGGAVLLAAGTPSAAAVVGALAYLWVVGGAAGR